jgi:hypothetical protein
VNGTLRVGNLNGTDTSTPPVALFGGFASMRPGFP